MSKVHVRPSRDLRNKYSELASIVKEHEPVIITNNGKGESVLINIEDYADFEEYSHRRYVLKELAKAKKESADPDAKWYDHDEVWRIIEGIHDDDV